MSPVLDDDVLVVCSFSHIISGLVDVLFSLFRLQSRVCQMLQSVQMGNALVAAEGGSL